MHTGKNAVEANVQQGPRPFWKAMRFTHLNAGDDAQFRIGRSAALEALNVGCGIEDRLIPPNPVCVFGERD